MTIHLTDMKNTIRLACLAVSIASLVGCLDDAQVNPVSEPEETDMNPIHDQSPTRAQLIPEGKTGWSSSGPIATQNRKKSLSCQADFTKGKYGAGMYTVQFHVNMPSVLARPQAIIKWSVEGGDVRRVIDVGPGTSISGVGQAVSVVLYDAVENAPPNTGAGTEYNVGIQVSPGTRASVSQPPTLLGGGALVNKSGGSAVFTVPTDAGVISAMVTYTGASAGTVENVIVVEEVDATGTNTLKAYYATPDGPTFIPIAPSTATIKVTNEDTNENATVIVTYGIDG